MAGRPKVAAAAAAAVLAMAALMPYAAAEKCTTSSPWGPVEYDCDLGRDEAAQSDDTPWWAHDTTQAIMAFAGIVASGAAAGYTYYRVRLRRKTLADYVRAVEDTYAQHKGAPAEGRPKLVALRHEVRARHQRGRIEDAQFLELDRRITGYVARLRVLDVTTRFPGLPPAFVSDLRTMVEDGTVSVRDVTLLAQHPALWRVSASTREEVLALVQLWAEEDGGGSASAPAVAPAHA